MARNVFIAYDFDIEGGLSDRLQWVKKNAGPEFEVNYPDASDARSQGEIWRDIVRPRIREADSVIAYVDLPNANVGYEIGYALGLHGPKGVALARVRDELPEWLKRPPFQTFYCPRIFDARELLQLVRGEKWVRVPRRPDKGKEALLLCPPTGQVYSDSLKEIFQSWRMLPQEGWTINDLPDKLQGIGAVVWLLVPHGEGAGERDGQENAATSVVAGFAAGLEIPVHVFTHSQSRVVVDVAGQGILFANTDQLIKLIEDLRPQLVRELAPPEESPTVSKPAVSRPELPPLPRLEEFEAVEELFIGRERLLADFGDALRGLDIRFRGDLPSGAAAVQAAWYDGFGGMGKSWFLRKAKLDTERRLLPQAKVALIDWDLPSLRLGLSSPPSEPRELFRVIAARLGQLYGVEALDIYWAAETRVDQAAGDRQNFIRHFGRSLAELASTRSRKADSDVTESGGQRDDILKALLLEDGLWVEDPTELQSNIDDARHDPEWLSRARQRWFNRGGGPPVQDGDAAVKPDELLVSALQGAIRSVARFAPLVLILDTCEVLSEEMDRWTRSLIVPLCDGACATLFLFGSRLPPDVAERPGIKRGWRAEIGDKLWRRVRFDREVHFTVDEVRQALGKVRRKVEDEEEVASKLHAITRGVPLALRTLLDLHESGDDVLSTSAVISDDTEPGAKAIDKVIEVTTNRFLLHLERNPGRARDMEDIVVLALLPRADHEVLSHIWGSGKVKVRLLELTRRYALITEGDLHESVRSFLRQRWRGEERPHCFPTVMKKLEAAIPKPPWKTSPADSEYFDSAALWLNLLSWSEGPAFLPKFAPSLTLALAFDADCTGLLNLALEIRQPAKEFRSARIMLERLLERRRALWLSEPWGTNEVLAWLDREARPGDWGQIERGALALLLGLKQAEEGHSIQALRNLEEADGIFGEHLPRKSEAGEAAQTIGLKLLEDRKWVDAEAAFGLQRDLNYLVSYATNALGVAKTYRHQFSEAERLFRRAAEMDPREPLFLRNLGDVLRQGRRWEEAATAYEQNLALNPDDAPTLNGLALLSQQRRPTPDPAEAERLFRRAAEMGRREPIYLCNLGDLLRENRRWEEAATAYEQSLALNPDDAPTLNGLALLSRERRPTPNLAEAERLFRRAAEIDPKEPFFLRSLGDALRQGRRWEEAATAYEQNLTVNPDDASTFNSLALLHQERRPTPDLTEAERLFRRAAEIDPREPAYLRNLGDLLRESRRWEEAATAYEQNLALNPDDAWTVNGLARLHQERRPTPNLAEAERLFRRAAEIDPKEPFFLRSLGDALRQGRRWEEAATVYEQNLTVNPDDASTFNSLALLHQERRPTPDLAEAERLFRRAAEINPKQPLYLRNLGDLLRESQRWEEAATAYEQNLALNPDDAWTVNGLALLHQERRPTPNLAEAERLFRRAAEIDPKEPFFLRSLGDALRQGRRWEEAATAYEQNLTVNPDDASTFNSLALLHQERRPTPDLTEAERLFRRAAEIDPREPAYLRNLGDLLRESRRWEEAATAYEQNLALNPDDAWTVNGLARLHQERRPTPNLAEAERLFRRAAEINPKEPFFLRSLGDALRQGRRWEEAATAYEQNLTVNPDDASTFNSLALLHQERRPTPDLAEAERLFRRAAVINPKQPLYLRNLGDLLRENRRWEEAATAYEQNLTVNPDDPTTLNGLAVLHQQRRPTPDFAEAERLFRRAAEIDPREPAYLRNLGDLLRESRRWEEAATAYEQNLALNPDDAWTVNGLARLHQERRPTPDLAEAERLFRRAAEIDPKQPIYLRNLGDLLRESQRWEEAATAYEQNLALNPDDAWTVNGLARLHQERRPTPNLAEAERLFRRAAEIDPKEPVYLRNLGDLLLDLGRTSEAAESFKKILEAGTPSAESYNSIAWSLYEHGQRLPDALTFAAQAIELNPETPEYRHTYADICLRLRLPSAMDAVQEWISRCDPEFFDRYRADTLATFATLLEHQKGPQLLALLESHGDAPAWSKWIAALAAVLRPETATAALDELAQELLRAFR